ncbi:MAG: N-acetyltransferase family protein [Kofleriaceae bacterium]
MPEWKAVLRAATPSDFDAVRAFYKENPSKNVLGRDEMVERACQDGRQFLVEVDGRIVATTGTYPIHDVLVEVGGTRVADAWQGFGLQDLLFRARFAAIVLTEDVSVRITTGVDLESAPESRHGIEKQGFEQWADLDPALLTECDPAPGRKGCEKKRCGLPTGAKCCCTFYLMPTPTLRERLKEFVELTQNSFFVPRTRKTDAAKMVVEIRCSSVTDPARREVLVAFCRGE